MSVLKTQYSEEHVITICIHLEAQTGQRISRVAKMWLPDTSKTEDLISARLVKEILCLKPVPFDEGEACTDSLGPPGERQHAREYVDLKWSSEKMEREKHTRFIVTSLYDPPFDVLLSPQTAINCGLASR